MPNPDDREIDNLRRRRDSALNERDQVIRERDTALAELTEARGVWKQNIVAYDRERENLKAQLDTALAERQTIKEANGRLADALEAAEAERDELRRALREIDEMLDGGLPITHQVKSLARQALGMERE